MDGTLGSQTAWMLDGSRRADHERRASSRRSCAQRGRGRASRSPCTRSATARTARRSTRSSATRDGVGAARAAPADRARAAARAARTCRGSRQLGVAASVQFSHAPSDRDLADRFWAGKTDGAYAYRSLWDSGAVVANGSDAPIEELDPLAGHPRGRAADDRRPRRLAPRAGGDGAAGVRGDVASRRRGSRARSGGAAGCCRASPPTSSCSTATRGRTSTRRSSRRWSAGRWVHNPPPW